MIYMTQLKRLYGWCIYIYIFSYTILINIFVNCIDKEKTNAHTLQVWDKGAVILLKPSPLKIL